MSHLIYTKRHSHVRLSGSTDTYAVYRRTNDEYLGLVTQALNGWLTYPHGRKGALSHLRFPTRTAAANAAWPEEDH
jgi:hypothetical protein